MIESVDIKDISGNIRFSTQINEGGKKDRIIIPKAQVGKYGRKNLSGLKFGRLTVMEESGLNKHRRIMWKCVCSCGNEVICSAASLLAGNTTSCGCYGKEQRTKANRKHGKSHSRLYYCWQGIKNRCYKKNNPEYYRYGGRGIQVCNEWKDSFSNFENWAISNGYNNLLTIDRIDFDKGYYPSNCRWITIQENAKNTSICIVFTINEIRDTLRGWSIRLGVTESTFRRKYKEVGKVRFELLITECIATGNKRIFSKSWRM